MANALAVLESRLLELGGTWHPIIWFARHDAPAGAVLPTAMTPHVLVVDGYKEWYNDVFEYLANNYLPEAKNKAREI